MQLSCDFCSWTDPKLCNAEQITMDENEEDVGTEIIQPSISLAALYLKVWQRSPSA